MCTKLYSALKYNGTFNFSILEYCKAITRETVTLYTLGNRHYNLHREFVFVRVLEEKRRKTVSDSRKWWSRDLVHESINARALYTYCETRITGFYIRHKIYTLTVCDTPNSCAIQVSIITAFEYEGKTLSTSWNNQISLWIFQSISPNYILHRNRLS